MARQRLVVEFGSGTDLQGVDYTKASCRAVQDALHHSSLILFRSLGIDPARMRVRVHLGVQAPAKVDVEAVAAGIPYGRVTVLPEIGGLDLVDADHGTTTVVATAGIAVSLPLPASRFTLIG